MGHFLQLDEMLDKQKGMLMTSQAISSGISKPVFYEYIRSRELVRAAHGIYLSKDSWLDTMYLLHLRFEQAVFSHETALYLHDLTDREPTEYTVTVKTGSNPSGMKREGVQVFTVKEELCGIGITERQTPFGHVVPVYDMERTICDIVRSRSKVETQIFQGALRAYVRRSDKDLRMLMKYAGMFKVERILRQYLEVLI